MRADRDEPSECHKRFPRSLLLAGPVRHHAGLARRSRWDWATCAKSRKGHWYRGISKVEARIDAPRIADDGFKIDVGAVSCRQPGIERRRWFPAGFACFIGFQCPLDDIGDRAPFPACEA